jgi:PAX-interacting protein 1
MNNLEKEYGIILNLLPSFMTVFDIYQGKVFYITPGVIPSPSVLADVIESAGGKVEKHRRSLKSIQELNQKEYTYFVITVGNDLHLLRDLIRNEIGKYKIFYTKFWVLS